MLPTWSILSIGPTGVDLAPDEHCVQLRGSPETSFFATFLRQTIQMQTPTIVINTVRILENTSGVETQTICHQLGQCPLISHDVTQLLDPETCGCWRTRQQLVREVTARDHHLPDAPHPQRMLESHALIQNEPACAKCAVRFKLSVRNDNAIELGWQGETLQVTTDHIERIPFPGQEQLTLNSVRLPAHLSGLRALPLFKLRRGQEFQGLFYAQRGVGLRHVKFDPVGPISVTDKLVVSVVAGMLRTMSDDQQQALVKSCPKQLFEIEDIGKAFRVRNDIRDCDNCLECVKYATSINKPELIRLRVDKHALKMFMALPGSLTGPQVMDAAFREADALFGRLLEEPIVVVAPPNNKH